MGMGGFPGNSYLSLGMLGMHGTRYANYAIGECDLLIAVGVRFDDRVTGKIDTFAPHARVIHIDIDAAEIGKNVEVEVPIVGQVKEVLVAINQRLEAIESEELNEWHETIHRWKEEYPLRYGDSSEGRIMPQHVIEEVYSLTRGGHYLYRVGQNQMWLPSIITISIPAVFKFRGLGTMGYGFPPIGAKITCPELPVVRYRCRWQSIQMNIQELGTAVQYRLPIIICILNNHFLGMVRQWQGLFYGGRYSYTDMSHQPDFVKIAEAYGAIGRRIKEASQVREALEEALKVKDRPVVLDFWVEREADVYPMVPPGGSLMNMLGGD